MRCAAATLSAFLACAALFGDAKKPAEKTLPLAADLLGAAEKEKRRKAEAAFADAFETVADALVRVPDDYEPETFGRAFFARNALAFSELDVATANPLLSVPCYVPEPGTFWRAKILRPKKEMGGMAARALLWEAPLWHLGAHGLMLVHEQAPEIVPEKTIVFAFAAAEIDALGKPAVAAYARESETGDGADIMLVVAHVRETCHPDYRIVVFLPCFV